MSALIGWMMRSAKIKIVRTARLLQSTVILRTTNFVFRKMSSIIEKHSFLTSKYGASPITEINRYERFFPKFNGNPYDQFLARKESPSSTSTRSTSFSFIDDGLSNTSSSFSRFVSNICFLRLIDYFAFHLNFSKEKERSKISERMKVVSRFIHSRLNRNGAILE